MCKIVELAISCGAKTVNIPDTVGYTTPSEFTKIITTLKIVLILIKQFYLYIVIMI